MIKNCVHHRRKIGDKILLIVQLRYAKNEDTDHEFQILQDKTFHVTYCFTGSYDECLKKYADWLYRLDYLETFDVHIPKPDLTEYYGQRIECGGYVQGRLSLGV